MTDMMGRQNHGVYTVADPRAIARAISPATRSADANSEFFFKCAVIGVSTKPGLTVMTFTPWAAARVRRPDA